VITRSLFKDMTLILPDFS